jgi:hypothetical protein
MKALLLEYTIEKAFILIIIAITLLACGAVPEYEGRALTQKPKEASDLQEPAWYSDRDQIDKYGLCGAGTSEFQGNRRLAENGAKLAASQELASRFEQNVKSLVSQGAQSGALATSEGSTYGTKSAQDDYMEGLVNQSLKNTKVVKLEKMGNEFFALICVDVKSMLDHQDQMKEIEAKANRLAEDAKKQLAEQQDKLYKALENYKK